MSLTMIENNKGPSTVPWGTPPSPRLSVVDTLYTSIQLEVQIKVKQANLQKEMLKTKQKRNETNIRRIAFEWVVARRFLFQSHNPQWLSFSGNPLLYSG